MHVIMCVGTRRLCAALQKFLTAKKDDLINEKRPALDQSPEAKPASKQIQLMQQIKQQLNSRSEPTEKKAAEEEHKSFTQSSDRYQQEEMAHSQNVPHGK